MKRRRQVSVPDSVVDWVERTDAEKIADTLLSVDETKAIEVLVKLGEKAGSDVQKVLDEIGAEFDRDPVGAFVRGAAHAVVGLSRRK